MWLVLVILLIPTAALAGANAYQAFTGRRLSKRPSKRTIKQLRRQSAVAAIVLSAEVLLVLAFLVSIVVA